MLVQLTRNQLQTLSFAMNGGGGQSKLVWTAGTNGMSKKFRNHI